MTKSGQCNIRHDAKEKTKRFLQDFFTTMVDMQWTYSFGIFLSFYAITWIVFSSVYYCVAHMRGDLDFYVAVKGRESFFEKKQNFIKKNQDFSYVKVLFQC